MCESVFRNVRSLELDYLMDYRKCRERVYHRYGEGICQIPTDPADPLQTFDDTNVEENVMRFVVYILWLRYQPDSFEKYLRVRDSRYDL